MGKDLYDEKRERFRTLLKQVRVEAGLTQVTLAAKLKRDQSFVSDYERGHRRLDWVTVAEVLAACGYRLPAFVDRYTTAIEILSAESGNASNDE